MSLWNLACVFVIYLFIEKLRLLNLIFLARKRGGGVNRNNDNKITC